MTTNVDDVTNCTNHSPFPMLHLLREESVARASAAYHNSNEIYERNIATMNAIGKAGMDALMEEAEQRVSPPGSTVP